MASPNAIFTEIVSTTFRNHSKEIADNFSKHNALYRRMGFYEIPPYRFNPFPDAMFWEKTIA